MGLRHVLGALLLLVFALVAWRLLAFVTGLVFHLIGLLFLAALGYAIYRVLVRAR